MESKTIIIIHVYSTKKKIITSIMKLVQNCQQFAKSVADILEEVGNIVRSVFVSVPGILWTQH